MRWQRSVSVGLGVAAWALLAAACGQGSPDPADEQAEGTAPAQEEEGAGEDSPNGDPVWVALVANQSAGDLGPIDDMIRGLERLEQELGARTTFAEALDPATYEASMRGVAEAGADVVVVTFPPMMDALANVAPDFPDTRWVHIFGFDGSLENAVSVGFATHEVVYVAGMLAGAVTGSDTVGYVGGAALPQSNANFNAFVRGATDVRGGVEGIPTFADSYEDPAKGLELASLLYETGVDVIMMDASATNEGVIEAARERGTYAIDFTAQRFERDADVIVGGVEILWGDTLFHFVELALGDDFVAGMANASLGTGGLELRINEAFLARAPAETVAAVDSIRPRITEALAAILDGSLDVPFLPDL